MVAGAVLAGLLLLGGGAWMAFSTGGATPPPAPAASPADPKPAAAPHEEGDSLHGTAPAEPAQGAPVAAPTAPVAPGADPAPYDDPRAHIATGPNRDDGPVPPPVKPDGPTITDSAAVPGKPVVDDPNAPPPARATESRENDSRCPNGTWAFQRTGAASTAYAPAGGCSSLDSEKDLWCCPRPAAELLRNR